MRRGRVTLLKSPYGTSTSVLFLVPQKPYNPIGSLADQITYPDKVEITAAVNKQFVIIIKLLHRSYIHILLIKLVMWIYSMLPFHIILHMTLAIINYYYC